MDAGPAGILDEHPLQQPLHEEFRVGTLVIAWDEDVDRLIVEARSMTFDAGAGESAVRDSEDLDEDDIPDDAPIGPDVLRVRLTPFMAQQFARRANSVSPVSGAGGSWSGAARLRPATWSILTPDEPGTVHPASRVKE